MIILPAFKLQNFPVPTKHLGYTRLLGWARGDEFGKETSQPLGADSSKEEKTQTSVWYPLG